ncbi:MAG: hypothetical protein P8X74_19660 [Reinekea sp.]
MIQSLETILESLEKYQQNFALYVAKDSSFDFENCCVLDPDRSKYEYAQEKQPSIFF